MCYRTGKYTVCSCVYVSFSPEILQAPAVKGLRMVSESHFRREKKRCIQPKSIGYLCHMPLWSSLEYGATVWDPYLKQDADRLVRVQRQTARFIMTDYRTRETGCVGHILQELNLPPLQERRKQQRLTTLYNIVKGHIPAMPPENFLTPADRSRRRIHPTTFKDCS